MNPGTRSSRERRDVNERAGYNLNQCSTLPNADPNADVTPMPTFMFTLLGTVILVAITSNVVARTAKLIDVRTLPGKIFFIGYRKTSEFKGMGGVDQLYVVKANGLECQLILPKMPTVGDLSVYPKLQKLTFNSISDDESKHGRFVLNIEEPWQPEQLEARLQRPLPQDFPVKFQNQFVQDTYWPIAFSPDGSLVAGCAEKGGFLHIADVKTGAVVAKIEGQFANEDFVTTWSPDGSKIVFMGCMFGDSQCNETELFIVDKNGNNLRQLTNNPRPYSWWTLFITPSARQPKYKERHNANSPVWSPDGQWIAYGSFYEIYKVRPDGSDATLIVKDAGHPAWSPDGSLIAYAAIRNDTPPLTKEEAGEKAGYQLQNIYVSWADGTGETRITNNRMAPRNFSYHELKWVE